MAVSVILLISLFMADPVAAGRGPTPLTALEPHFRKSVLHGWRAFQTSHADDGVACVHCHLDHETIRRWARAYPKVEVFDGTPYRVKTLRQVVLEALERHSDLGPARRLELVDGLVAYIAWWGDGLKVSPGHSRDLPPPSEDLKLLRESARRGLKLIAKGSEGNCRGCHESTADAQDVSVGQVAARFPKFVPSTEKVMPLSVFVAYHLEEQGKVSVTPDGKIVIDILAGLALLAEGQTYLPGHLMQE